MTSPIRAAVKIGNSRARAADAFLPTKLGHEVGDLGIWQRRMMLDPRHLGLLRQQVFQMAAPTRRVLAVR